MHDLPAIIQRNNSNETSFTNYISPKYDINCYDKKKILSKASKWLTFMSSRMSCSLSNFWLETQKVLPDLYRFLSSPELLTVKTSER